MLNRDVRDIMSVPWAMEMKSISIEEPERLVETGVVNIIFEFERQNCADIYCALMGSGLELSPGGHATLTALCQCTNRRQESCGKEVASIELEIQTFPCRR